ncbi:MAG: YidB family protein [Burkholderiaceae bacterium]
MSLLTSVLGAALGGGQQQGGAGGLGNILGSLLGGGGQAGGGLNAQLINAAIGMLGNDGAQGGLGGLAAKFQQAGLGDAMNSWIGTGENQPVDADQVTNALGQDTISDLASKLGMSHGDAAGQLSQILPGLINHLTPNGQAPAGGLGNAGDLMGMLGGLLQKR